MKNDKDSFDTNAIPFNTISKQPHHLKNMTADGHIPGDLSSAIEGISLPSERHQFCLVRAHKRFKTRWNLLLILLCTYLIVFVPFLISFTPAFRFEFIWVNVGIDGIFFIDSLIHFFTTYIGDKGEIKDLNLISTHYLKRTFAFDLFCICPFDFITAVLGYRESNFFIAAWLINLLKVRNLTRSSKVIRNWQTSSTNKSIVKILELLLYIIVWVHCSACIWFAIIKHHEEWMPLISWYKDTKSIYSLDVSHQYAICFYYGVWLTLGNEVTPHSYPEYISASLLIILGAIGTAVLLGEMAVIISEMNESQAAHQQSIDSARSNLEALQIPSDLLYKILTRIVKNQNYMRSHEEHETFRSFVSPSIQLKIAQALYDPILSTNPVFASEANLLTFLLDKIQIRFAKDEEEVISEGQEARSLFFLITGEIKVFSFNHSKRKNEKVCFLQAGSHFGELGLIYGGLRRASCVSEGYSTLAELSKNDFFLLSNQNTGIVPKLREFCENYVDWTKGFVMRSMKFQSYFQSLPNRVVHELPFMMKFCKVDKGRYLFRPGELCREVVVLVEGKLEISVTINDRYLQYLKVQEDIADASTLSKSPDLNTESNYPTRSFDLFSVNGLKRLAEIFPYITSEGDLKYSKSEEFIPQNSQKIGNYPQEIILCTVRPGALLNSRLVLFQKQFEIQCKATEPSVYYSLPQVELDLLSKTYFNFKKALIKEKKSNLANQLIPPLTLDILQIYEKGEDFRMLFKENVLRVILSNRSERLKKSKNISGLCNKIKAILACQSSGEYDLAEKIMQGKVMAENISEDGKLIKASMKKDQSLPASHPIIETFRVNLENLSDPQSVCLSSYNIFAQEVLNESQRVAEVKKTLYEVKSKLQGVINKFKDSAGKEDLRNKKSKNLLNK